MRAQHQRLTLLQVVVHEADAEAEAQAESYLKTRGGDGHLRGKGVGGEEENE